MSCDEVEKKIEGFVTLFGWGALVVAFMQMLGFTLHSAVLLEDGACRRTFTHPDGSTATFTEVINDQPDRDSNQYEK